MKEKEILQRKFADRLKQLMESNNETTYSIAEIIDMSNSTVSRYLNRDMSPKTTTIKVLAQHFGVNPAWLMGFDVDKNMPGNTQKSKNLPVVGCIAAGSPVIAEEDIIDYEPAPADDVKEGDFWLEVSGNSMINAGINEGDRVLIRRTSEIINNKIYAVMVNSDECTLKRVMKTNGQLVLQPENPSYENIICNNEDVKIIGRAVQVTKKL